MIETRGGSKLWELRADRAEVHEREGYTVLSRVNRPVEVTLYSNQGQLVCTANRATVDLTTKDVRLEGGVFGRSDQGTELRTEALRWLAASRRLHTDQPVTLSRGGWLSRGRGLEAETDLEQVRIFQNITSQMRSPAITTARPPAPGSGPAAGPGSAPGVKPPGRRLTP
jgi:LPS export ABC transporter protein LptC